MGTAVFASQPVESWGRVVRRPHRLAQPRFQDEIGTLVGQNAAVSMPASFAEPALARSVGDGSLLPVGLGRSYGDSGLNPSGRVIGMTDLDRVLRFDAAARVLRAEAGMSLDSVLRLIVPHGLFTTTTPGTRFVTLGGAVANDVHGKNHETAGTFGASVRRLGLVRSDRGYIEIGPDQDADLFAATIGGLGLTGIITWVEIDLTAIGSANLGGQRRAFPNLDGFFTLAQDGSKFEHSVAWIDGTARGDDLGRGIYQRANWAADGRLEPHSAAKARAIPYDAPNQLLNHWSIKAFNTLHYHLQRAPRDFTTHYRPFFYPLDGIGHWNRLYGPRGFYQYQCVLPPETARDGLRSILTKVSADGSGSFLAVLKRLGSRPSPGLVSFPCDGYTFAMDFANRGPATLDLMARLDNIVIGAGGRLYAAKDGRMPASLFRTGYPNWRTFAAHVDPALCSDFWRRVSA